MRMAKRPTKPDELIKLMVNPDTSEDQRIQNINNAVTWILGELEGLKTQDQTLMRQFKSLRSEINNIKENGLDIRNGLMRRSSLLEMSTASDKEFDGAQECNLTPLDSGEMIGMRRRAYSSVERVRKYSGRKISADHIDFCGAHLSVIVTNEES